MTTAIQILDEMIHNTRWCTSSDKIRNNILVEAKSRIQALWDGWILMSDKTPSEWWEYIVYCRVDWMTTREWDSDQNKWIHWDRESLYALEEITHWKPLWPLPNNS